ncbi:MAG: CAP domain-containing protein [Actinobacteria bacterium]|nr:CAP domain-containing protein [Actinomycetota bacterium]
MSASKRIFTGIVAGVVLSAFIPATQAGAACYSNNKKERQFASKINLARRATGRVSLKLDPQLSKAAKVHTREMVNKNLLYHTPTETLKRRVTNWYELGENVGVGSTVTSLHTAFMNSTAHRANILYSGFRYVGIGAVKANGRLWVTVIFESRADPGSRLC